MNMFTSDEAAPLLRLSPESVRRLIREGRIKAVKIGKRYMIAPAEIDRIKAEGTEPVILAGGRVFRSPSEEGETS